MTYVNRLNPKRYGWNVVVISIRMIMVVKYSIKTTLALCHLSRLNLFFTNLINLQTGNQRFMSVMIIQKCWSDSTVIIK